MNTRKVLAKLTACLIVPAMIGVLPTACAQGSNAMSPLQNLLTTFATSTAASWPSFDNVADVRWKDAKPLENPDSNSPDTTRYRSGNLLLTGFGEVEVPDGKIGSDAGTRKDNEGNVGVTLNGDAAAVQSIALQKFYPSENFQQILQQQLTNEAKIHPVASHCAFDYGTKSANTQNNTFYRVEFGAGIPVYAEAYVDADGGNQGPGSTTFVFYRSEPTQRLEAMQCKKQ